ncbi:hypothetical protein Cni_G02661 [Canna indica]|uniref:ARM repeat superfamily protein n=1 Tax=Canna indica TaxID=4628 RepID=A0AAQ3Q067_9LILI|nr:hypothetical protein Cni_G02661 [Canna indica]
MAPAPEQPGTAEVAEEKEMQNQDDEEAADAEDDEEDEDAPTHLPLAPHSELLDMPTTVDPSYIISLIRQLLPHDLTVEKPLQVTGQCPTSTADGEMKQECAEDGRNNDDLADKQPIDEDTKDPWEDCGCILWDLAASKSHAELMVSNLILEVLLANLRVTDSSRVIEICVGIIGNLACHESLSTAIVSTNGLIETIVDQLFQDDSTCLSETFRLLNVSLQSSRFVSWAEALLPDQIISRILWIIGNTLNPILLEKSIEFLLTVIHNQEVGAILLQPLVKLGLPNLSVSLLESEMNKPENENKVERFSVLDLFLQLIEALSAVDNCSDVITSNSDLFHLVCKVVKLPDKIEVASCCVSAVVILANILADEQHLISNIWNDLQFLQGLLDVLPLVSDDSQARSALWCILNRFLLQFEENVKTPALQRFALVFVDKSFLIEEDLDSHNVEEKSDAVTTTLSRISSILEKLNTEKSWDDDEGKAKKLLSYCRKYCSLARSGGSH